MTPFSDFLWKHLPPPLAMAALILCYTALLLSILLLIESGPVDMIYLDMGRTG
ncbi:MAG: hypothetical protein NXI27_12030 [Alphaproteobacteria bacterium]|nr:hypothetical protein [Alphaproteobacteria bacterium]